MEDVTGLDEWIVQLDKAQSGALPEAEAILSKGALNIKKDWARRWSGHPHIKALPAAIGYDLYHLLGSARARIGPDKAKRQGPLASIIEYGSANNPPMPGGAPALDAEGPKFERALEDLGAKLLGD
jgi:hypothetical protein